MWPFFDVLAGHGVVSRREALERAKSLKLDLVEVIVFSVIVSIVGSN